MTQELGRNGSSVGKNEGGDVRKLRVELWHLTHHVGDSGRVAESSFNRGLTAFVYIRALSCLMLVFPSTDTVQYQATGLSNRCSQAKTLAAKSPSLWVLGQNRRPLPVMRHCSAFGVRWVNHSLLHMPLLSINLSTSRRSSEGDLCAHNYLQQNQILNAESHDLQP